MWHCSSVRSMNGKMGTYLNLASMITCKNAIKIGDVSLMMSCMVNLINGQQSISQLSEERAYVIEDLDLYENNLQSLFSRQNGVQVLRKHT